MANVEYKSAVYTIGPSSSKQFTFWWGKGSTGVEYFDVSIGVDPQPRHPSQLPLVEEKRAYLWDQSEGDPRQVLLLFHREPYSDFQLMKSLCSLAATCDSMIVTRA